MVFTESKDGLKHQIPNDKSQINSKSQIQMTEEEEGVEELKRNTKEEAPNHKCQIPNPPAGGQANSKSQIRMTEEEWRS